MARYDVFISYRREGGLDIALLIREKLKTRGYKVFLDREDLRAGRFNQQLYKRIDSCKDLLVILTPECLERTRTEGDWVRNEVAYALGRKKNVVPILHRDFRWPQWVLPKDIRDLVDMQGVAPSYDEIDASVDRLTKLLKSRTHLYVGKIAKAVLALLVVLGLLVAVNALRPVISPTPPEPVPNPVPPKPTTVYDVIPRPDR